MHRKDAAFLHGADERTALGLKRGESYRGGQKGSKTASVSETCDLIGSNGYWGWVQRKREQESMTMDEGGRPGVACEIFAATRAQAETVERGFARFVSARHPGLADESADIPVRLVISDATGAIAGLLGKVFWQGLEIEVLGVVEAYRGGGLGQRLFPRAEAEARVLGATVAYLRTARAASFYERCGHRHCGYLPRPPGTGLHGFHEELAG